MSRDLIFLHVPVALGSMCGTTVGNTNSEREDETSLRSCEQDPSALFETMDMRLVYELWRQHAATQ